MCVYGGRGEGDGRGGEQLYNTHTFIFLTRDKDGTLVQDNFFPA